MKQCEREMLRVQTAELWKVGDKNMPALQVFVSMYPSWFSELVMIDRSIMVDIFKELEDIDAMLMEGDN